MLNVNQTSRALSAINDAQRLVITCHANPDGDAIGSLLGLFHALHSKYPTRAIITFCKDPVPCSFHFLPGALTIGQDYAPARGDTVFFLDAAEPKLTKLDEEYPELFVPTKAEENGIHTIKIDHHPTGTVFARHEFVDADAASSCEIVVDLLDALDFSLSADAATCLLTGIYTDTGSMMHSNTSTRVYRTACRLMQLGADQEAIVKNVFRTSKVSTLKLWGRVLEHISLTEDGVAITALTAGDFRATGADFSELTGAIDYVNSIPGMKFSMVLSQRDDVVRGSLRTLREDVDVSKMAQKFSGGGHKKAAGFSVKGKLEQETRWKVVPESEGVEAKK
jgi:bifunctional oligoribonuclease and PAP phosphatase NrnA